MRRGHVPLCQPPLLSQYYPAPADDACVIRRLVLLLLLRLLQVVMRRDATVRFDTVSVLMRRRHQLLVRTLHNTELGLLKYS